MGAEYIAISDYEPVPSRSRRCCKLLRNFMIFAAVLLIALFFLWVWIHSQLIKYRDSRGGPATNTTSVQPPIAPADAISPKTDATPPTGSVPNVPVSPVNSTKPMEAPSAGRTGLNVRRSLHAQPKTAIPHVTLEKLAAFEINGKIDYESRFGFQQVMKLWSCLRKSMSGRCTAGSEKQECLECCKILDNSSYCRFFPNRKSCLTCCAPKITSLSCSLKYGREVCSQCCYGFTKRECKGKWSGLMEQACTKCST